MIKKRLKVFIFSLLIIGFHQTAITLQLQQSELSRTNTIFLDSFPEISQNIIPSIRSESLNVTITYIDQLLNDNDTPIKKSNIIKDWTFITYMAADNDLAPFARKNLKQQTDVGSNQYINVVTQLDTRIAGNKKITKRYYIEKNKLIVTNQNDPATQKMDSGLPSTLIDCCKWAVQNFPARNYALILWNHGTGALDIIPRRTINPLPLFMFNPESNLLELDRSISFIDFIQARYSLEYRAICFDDSTGHFLNNQDLEYALQTICSTILNGKKFSMICFDACLMSMIEIANIVKNYADYMTASQEVELGTGYDYYKILKPFEHSTLQKDAFAQHVIYSYRDAYSSITNDYTQSALNLSTINLLEANIDMVASLLLDALKNQKNHTVKDAIKLSRHKLYCTHFDEPSYLDLHHLYLNLLNYSKKFTFINYEIGKKICKELEIAINNGLRIIDNLVIANTVGKNLSKAHGISIYFPERRINPTYQKTKFAQSNKWFAFLKYYLASER